MTVTSNTDRSRT